MNKIVLVTLSLTICLVGLITMQVVNGQVSDRPNPLRDIIEHGLLTSIDRVVVVEPTQGLMNIVHKIDEINTVLDYCYQHADNPNPVQDLVNKGLVNSSEFMDDTCGSVKQMSDNIPNAILELEINTMRQLCEDPPKITDEECQGTLR